MENSCHILAAHIVGYIWQIVFMMILLMCSAFFSGSETAFFHLPRRLVRQFSRSPVRLERLIAIIITDPNRLLTALLLGNMSVNVLFFAISSMLSLQVGKSFGAAMGTCIGVISFLLMLLCGEMLPKSLAYSNAKRFCLVTSPVCYLLVRMLGPILRMMDMMIVRPAVRLFIRPEKEKGVSINQLKILLESSRRQGLISNDENQLLAEILKSSFLKTRHVMQPRVEMPACSLNASARQIKQTMIQNGLVKIPVYTNDIDSIVGIVHLRDVFLNPNRPAASFVRKVQFLPEQKTVESTIEFFKKTRTDMAIIVDEYGGIAGWVKLEDIIEQLLGSMEDVSSRDIIEQIGPMEYRLSAGLSIHNWGEAFGIDIQDQRLATMGGFVTALLGKIPKQGDVAMFKNMKFRVEEVRNNRICSVTLSLEPLVDFASK